MDASLPQSSHVAAEWKMPPHNSRQWRESLHRGVALGAAISLHLFLLVLLVLITRPVAEEEDRERVLLQNRQALQLRFFPLSESLESHRQAYTRASVSMLHKPQAITSAAPAKTKNLVNNLPSASKAPAPALNTTASVLVERVASGSPQASATYDGDGGFSNQLRQAQRSYSVRPLPGSDAPRVGGIQLIDPKTQGFGAAMRQAQRLFGITNHHCIDVDAWRSMTPQQLLARHISPSDVDKVDAENECNRPMGLSF